MRPSDAFLRLLCLSLLCLGPILPGVASPAALPPAEGTAEGAESQAPVEIYGMEIETLTDRDRLLVFARGTLEVELIEQAPGVLILSFPNAILDSAAATRLQPETGGPVTLVSSFQVAGAQPAEVRMVVRRAPGALPDVSQRGSMMAVDFAHPEIGDGSGLTLRFDDADLADVVRAVSAATGEPFLFDDSLRGRVTIFVADRVSPAEALEILYAALWMKGFAAVPTPGGLRKIVAIDAGVSGAPWTQAAPGEGAGAPITTLVRLASAGAESVAGAIKQWVGSQVQLIPYAPTNSLILAGSEQRLHTLLSLVRALDEAASETLIVRRLRHRDADEVAAMLQGVFERSTDRRKLPIEIWPERHSNALIVRTSPGLENQVREWISRLDEPPETGGRVDVIKLRYASAERIAEQLRALAAGETIGPAEGTTSGTLAGRSFSLAVDVPTASLVVAADPVTLSLIRELAAELDRIPPRVHVEVVILEINTGDSLRLGVDAFIPLTDPNDQNDLRANVVWNPSGGGLLNPGPEQGVNFAGRYTREPLVIPIVDNDGNPIELILPRESVVVTADGRKIESRVLMRPHLLVASGEEQELFVGDNVPIPKARVAAADGGALDPFSTSQSVERRDVGLRVRVLPTVGAAGGVRLELDVDKSRVVDSLAGAVEEVGATIEGRRLTATIHLDSGQFAIVGIATGESLTELDSGPPFLRNIPALRRLFSATRTVVTNSYLVIAVQAWVHRSGAEQMADTIRRRLGFARALARVEEVPIEPGKPYALLIDTASTEDEARKVKERFEAAGREAALSAWDWSGIRGYDVYLTGFGTLAEAGFEAVALVEDGYRPQVVALPGATLGIPAQ